MFSYVVSDDKLQFNPTIASSNSNFFIFDDWLVIDTQCIENYVFQCVTKVTRLDVVFLCYRTILISTVFGGVHIGQQLDITNSDIVES